MVKIERGNSNSPGKRLRVAYAGERRFAFYTVNRKSVDPDQAISGGAAKKRRYNLAIFFWPSTIVGENNYEDR
ncbi:hypothetical protein [Chimaeribacter californicus]|uniref:hypothetical protein n=1 Tax=Chimaeribacter californicus TaxID=2060067 RepID=UPI0011AF452F|nr:hypothetical protein [Chimaeribacter californicus]